MAGTSECGEPGVCCGLMHAIVVRWSDDNPRHAAPLAEARRSLVLLAQSGLDYFSRFDLTKLRHTRSPRRSDGFLEFDPCAPGGRYDSWLERTFCPGWCYSVWDYLHTNGYIVWSRGLSAPGRRSTSTRRRWYLTTKAIAYLDSIAFDWSTVGSLKEKVA